MKVGGILIPIGHGQTTPELQPTKVYSAGPYTKAMMSEIAATLNANSIRCKTTVGTTQQKNIFCVVEREREKRVC